MSEKEALSMMARKIACEAGVEMDFEGLERVREVIDRISPRWPSETMRVLQEKNSKLLEHVAVIESHLNSLILLPNKPAILKKQFKERLQEYEKALEMCVEYVGRHTKNNGGI